MVLLDFSRSMSTFLLAIVLVPMALPEPGHAEPAGADPARVVAVVGFEPSQPGLAAAAEDLATLLHAELSARSFSSGFVLVERQELDAILSELELGLSGTVSPSTAATLGRMLGAKVLVMGRLMSPGGQLTVAARTIGIETSRVYVDTVVAEGAEVHADPAAGAVPSFEPLSGVAARLAERIADGLDSRWDTLVAAPRPDEGRIAALARAISGQELPTLTISIEERHQGRGTLDPAAETELGRILLELGFELLAPTARIKPDVQITGEALSEVQSRHGNLISARGRVEVKAVEVLSQRLVAVDRQTEIAVDLSPEMAGKTALQRAAAILAERLVLALVETGGKTGSR